VQNSIGARFAAPLESLNAVRPRRIAAREEHARPQILRAPARDLIKRHTGRN
jgi:hypothetical protein